MKCINLNKLYKDNDEYIVYGIPNAHKKTKQKKIFI